MHHIVFSLSQKMCARREMSALEQDDLLEIKLDFSFFLCLLSQRGNREQPWSSLENEFLLRQGLRGGGRQEIGIFQMLVLYKS